MTVSEAAADTGLLRSVATISAWNTVSRITGFGRVLAVGAALGTTFVGNTYQSANLVSNLLFELLAAGLLSAPLVPAFVGLLDDGRRDEVERLAGALLGLALVVLGGVVIAAAVAGPAIMRVLTAAMDPGELRDAEIRLGSFLLWFFLPQVLLYAVLAIATAVLNAERRFSAAAMAPIANNLVVIATMLVFVDVRSGVAPSMDLPLSDRLLLAIGTTAGVVAMAAIPLVAIVRNGFTLRPMWEPRHPRLREIVRVGAWGGAVLASMQVLILTTLVLANPVPGGVVAYQIAFTFFLLPIALAAHPVFTALYPQLAGHAHARRWARFGDDVGDGLRRVVFLVLPASVALIVVGSPALRVIRMGELDRSGAVFVGRVLAAYALGLAGYGCFLLLARAWTAAGMPRVPALVAGGVAAGGSLLMFAGTRVVDGDDRVVVLGIAHSVAMSAGAVVLFVLLRRRCGGDVAVVPTVARSLFTALVGGVAAAAAVDVIDTGGRTAAAAATVAGLVIVGSTVVLGQWLLRAPEMHSVLRALRGAR